MPKILITGGVVLAMDPAFPMATRGDILINDDCIVAMGCDLDAGNAVQFDASGMVVMPGLVNAHLHCWQTPLRGLATNWTLADYLQKVLGQIGPRFSPEDVYWATFAAALDQIDAGVTTIVDWCHNAPTSAHADAALMALRDAGIRALFLHNVTTAKEDLHAPNEGKWREMNIPAGSGGLLSTGMSILGPAYAPLEQVRWELDRAKALGQIVSMHFACKSSTNVFRDLAAEGRITPKVNIVHGNGLDREEIRALVDCGATFTVTPEVEMQMGFSPCITGEIRAQGARPSLGVDTETTSSCDMFQVTRFALQLQRYMDHQRARALTGEPLDAVSVAAREALEWATIEGARAAGLESSVGSLMPGKQADLILVRMPDLSPNIDPIQLLVSRAVAADVDTVFISGKMKKHAGRRLGPSRDEVALQLAQVSRRTLPLASVLPI